jgi:hypothetical protein
MTRHATVDKMAEATRHLFVSEVMPAVRHAAHNLA